MTFFVRLQADDMEQKQVRSFTSPCGHQTPSFLKKAKTFFFFCCQSNRQTKREELIGIINFYDADGFPIIWIVFRFVYFVKNNV